MDQCAWGPRRWGVFQKKQVTYYIFDLEKLRKRYKIVDDENEEPPAEPPAASPSVDCEAAVEIFWSTEREEAVEMDEGDAPGVEQGPLTGQKRPRD